MSLFFVDRYLGEDEDLSAHNESRSLELLAKLKQKAKEKQRRSETEKTSGVVEVEEDPEENRQAEEDDGRPALKSKRRKVEAASGSEEENEQKRGKKEKKKKKKSETEKPTEDRSAQDGETEEPTAKATPSPAPPGYQVLGGFQSKPAQKVQRVLPHWLARPDIIHGDVRGNLVAVEEVAGLSERLRSRLNHNGIRHLFPVQAEVVPAVLEGAQPGTLIGRGGYKPRDLCVSAPTGSGKTLAFVIPVIQVLMERVVCEVRALAVLPTKELAQQVYKVFCSYAEGTGLRAALLVGQRSLASEEAALSELRAGKRRSLADIVVATPGRLVDHINGGSALNLRQLRFLIIDEADRMMDGVHRGWLGRVEAAVFGRAAAESVSVFGRSEPTHATAASLSPPQVPLQKLLFSATLTQNPEKLQQLGLHRPRLFSSVCGPQAAPGAGRFDFPRGLAEFYVPCTLSKKPLLILDFLLRLKLSPVLCFCNSRETAHRLYLLLHIFGGVRAAEFSSRLSVGDRKRTLKEFERGKIQMLISTDATARGIDVTCIKCVVNYDAPQYIRTYIHRIGRTARAGKGGLAFTFLLGIQEEKFLQMVSEAGSPGIQKHIVKPGNLKSLEARYGQALQELAVVVKNEKAK